MKLLVGIIWTVLTISLTSCGGSQDVVMPDVAAKRLDVALSDIERAGVDDEVEVLGGGTFGIVDESNWMVCDQEPGAGRVVEGAPRLTVDRTCNDPEAVTGDPDATPDEDTDSSASGAPDPTPTADDTPSEEAGSAGQSQATEKFTMPLLVGMNLQDAQDTLQSLDSFILTQTDATGMERFQMVDSGWKVCSQRPAAGASVPLERMVDLGVVKLRESCR